MSDHHDWDHHDDGVHHEPDHQVEEVLPVEELPADQIDDLQEEPWEEPAPYDEPLPVEHHDVAETEETDPPAEMNEVVGADPDALPDEPVTAEVFPPMVDVGDLPEPVDGFPWIDTGSLGVVPPLDAGVETTPDPAELAAYAAEDLPPGQDPWAVLKDSDDPATSALARFYEPGRTSPDS